MKKQIQVKPQVNRLINILALIEEGKFKIPTFQRDFIWEDKQKIDLFDSIINEYPIGSILLWKPKEEYSNKNEIGPFFIKNFNQTDFYYILDGYQRLSTLFGCLTNPSKTKLEIDEEKHVKKFNMVYDLVDEAFLMKRTYSRDPTCIPVYKLIDTYEFLDFIDQLRADLKDDTNVDLYITRAKKISSTIIDYQIPSIEIIGGEISEAVEIFSRVNSKGIEISPDWMLSALSSNEDIGFNLGEIFSTLLDDLKSFNFDKIDREILVQCIQNSFGKIYFDQKLEALAKRSDFHDVTFKTIESIKLAIRFLFEELLVIDKRLLPYSNQLIFFVHFFNSIKQPSKLQIEKLKKWFWITTYSNYFTIYSLSKIRDAFVHFNHFLSNPELDPIYYHNDNIRFTTADLPKSISSGSVRSKAFQLFLINSLREFKPINSNLIEGYRIDYLFKSIRSHANFVPTILKKHNTELNDLEIEGEDMFFPKDDNFLKFREFITGEKINNNDLNSIDEINQFLNQRIKIIEMHERSFVENLNISYQSIS